MFVIQRITYIHHRYVESGFAKDQQFIIEVAHEINLKGIGEGVDNIVVNNFYNYYQLDFRCDPVWNFISKVVDLWQNGEIKGQAAIREQKKGKADTSTKPSGPADIRMNDWRTMQGIKDNDVIVGVLSRVVDNQLSLGEMSAKFERHKLISRIEIGFCSLLNLPTLELCMKTYPEHCSEVVLRGFQKTFQEWLSKGRRRPSKAKCK